MCSKFNISFKVYKSGDLKNGIEKIEEINLSNEEKINFDNSIIAFIFCCDCKKNRYKFVKFIFFLIQTKYSFRTCKKIIYLRKLLLV